MTKLPHLKSVLLASLALLVPVAAHATKFSNNFTEFELPAGWTCQLDEYTWTCQTTDEKIQGDALMVLAAKKKTDNDTLNGIQTYLWKPRHIKSETGLDISSKPNYVKSTEINGQIWVDSLHMESELPDYYTRYMATIKDDIMVLLTYSIEKSKYDIYKPQLDALIRSVKVFKMAEPAVPKQAVAPQFLPPGVGGSKQGFGGNLTASKDAPVQKMVRSSGGGGGGGSMLLLLLLGGGGFYIYKKKKQQQSGEPPAA